MNHPVAHRHMAEYADGIRAARLGHPLLANPHAHRSVPWYAWDRGWRDHHEAARKAATAAFYDNLPIA